MLVHAEEGRSVSTTIMQAMKNQPSPGRVKNDSYWQYLTCPMGEGPRRWIQNDNKNKRNNKSNNKNTAAKEDTTDSIASMTKLISTQTTIMAEKEDDTDSTATVTTAAVTLFSASG